MTRRTRWRAALTLAAIVGLTAAGATSANATTAYPEGGTWNYGLYEPGGLYSYSRYQHTYKTHGSSLYAMGSLHRSADKLPGYLASVEKPAWWTGNNWYYRVIG